MINLKKKQLTTIGIVQKNYNKNQQEKVRDKRTESKCINFIIKFYN